MTDVLSRRLEQVVLSAVQLGPSVPSDCESIDDPANQRAELPLPELPTPTVSTPADIERNQGYKEDFLWLEGVGTGENGRLPSLSPPFRIRVSHVHEILEGRAKSAYHEHDIPLPLEDEAAVFLEYYTERIDPGQHFTHGPTCKWPVAIRLWVCKLVRKMER